MTTRNIAKKLGSSTMPIYSSLRDERNLFRFLSTDRPLTASGKTTEQRVEGLYDKVSLGKTVIALADQVPVAMQDPRILKSWIFTHGLASLVSSGVLDLPDERIQSLLS